MNEDRICFVIMPISDTPSYEAGHFNMVYDYIIKPAIIKAGFIPLRADEVKKTNFIIIDILKQIINSSMCICDLSSRNPNVLYELGIRQALRLPVTIIRDTKTPRVFDIQGLRDIEYNESLRIDNVNSSIECISETILNTYNNTDNDINSIVDLLDIFPRTSLSNVNGKQDKVFDPQKYELQTCINNFIIDKERDGMKKISIKSYKYQLRLFAEYTDKKVNEFAEDDIKLFLSYREKNSKITKATMENARCILKSFFDWLVDESLISRNPVNRIKPYKINKTYKEALSETELNKIKMACTDLREKALIEVLCSTGCNLNEIVNLEISKIDWETNEIIVDSDTKSSRVVFLTTRAVAFLKEYLDSREDDCKEVFVTSRKPYKRLGGRSIQREIKSIAKRTDLNKNITPRTFRDTYAKIMLKKGCPLNILQALLGHESHSSTVETSLRLNLNNKKDIYQKYFT